jgi:hypothetical protein
MAEKRSGIGAGTIKMQRLSSEETAPQTHYQVLAGKNGTSQSAGLRRRQRASGRASTTVREEAGAGCRGRGGRAAQSRPRSTGACTLSPCAFFEESSATAEPTRCGLAQPVDARPGREARGRREAPKRWSRGREQELGAAPRPTPSLESEGILARACGRD